MVETTLSLVAHLALAATSSVAPATQVAIVLDDSVLGARNLETEARRLAAPVLADLTTLLGALAKAEGGAEVARVECRIVDREVAPRVVVDFATEASTDHAASARVAPRRWSRCTMNADVVAAALTRLAWRPEARRAVLIVTRERPAMASGRRTLQEVVADAEHLGIVVHALAFDPDAGRGALAALSGDLRRFRADPTRSVRGAARHLRPAALRSGGTYRVSVQVEPPSRPPPRGRPTGRGPGLRFGAGTSNESLRRHARSGRRRWREAARRELERRAEARAEAAEQVRRALRAEHELAAAYGPTIRGRGDVLSELAAGRIRPGEVRLEQRPAFLVGAPLEPLLDVIWDFVDARAAAEQVIASVAVSTGGGETPPTAGIELATAILAGARPAPSKR